MRSPLAPRFRLYIGSNGKTIPNPIRSMKTVRKMTRTEGFLMNNKQPLTRRLQAQSATTSAESMCERLTVKREYKHQAPNCEGTPRLYQVVKCQVIKSLGCQVA